MNELSIYFARAMDARSEDEIKSEEEEYRNSLELFGGTIINPYRSPKQDPDQDGLSIAQQDGFDIARNDLALLEKSDIVLADLSIPKYQYVGCIYEIVHAKYKKIPVIVVDGANNFCNRFFIQAHCHFIARNSDEAIKYIQKIFTNTGVNQQMEIMHKYYDNIAEIYTDKSMRTHKYSPEIMKSSCNEREELRSVIRKYVKGKVCQIGIGTGDWTQTICETANEVFGIDQSPRMLAQARRNLASFNNIQFVQCDFLKENLDQNSFDCVILYFLISLLPPSMQDILFSKIERILKPNGLLILADTKKISDRDDIFCMGLGRRQLQFRKWIEKPYAIYKEHFVGDSLFILIEEKGYKVINSSKETIIFSWAVTQK